MIHSFCITISSGTAQSIYFIITIRKMMQVFSGDKYKIVSASFHSFCKLFRSDKNIPVINKKYRICCILYKQFPVFPAQCSAWNFTDKIYSAGISIMLCLPYHINERCFPCCAVSTDYGYFFFYFKFIIKPVVFTMILCFPVIFSPTHTQRKPL